MLAELAGPDLIILIVVLVVVLFGGTQIPKLARSLGSAHSEFKKGVSEGAAESKAADNKAADNKDATKDSAKTDGDAATS
jgi:sec-independent protein translocase protein TatA